jgi:hypothetical protein
LKKVSNIKGSQTDKYKLLLTTGIMGGATNTAKTADSKNETYLSGNVGIKYRF